MTPVLNLSRPSKAGHYCNNASLATENDRYHIIGDPTEGALVVSAAKAGINSKPPRLDELPFHSELMYMATLHQDGERNVIYVKGSPEKIINMCEGQLVGGKTIPLDKKEILDKAAAMAGEALRVLAMAYKIVAKDKISLAQGYERASLSGPAGHY